MQQRADEKHTHWNQCFVSGEVLSLEKEIADPRDLHEHGANSAQDRKRTPFIAPRDGKQTDIEHRDVSEKSKWIVLSGGQKDRGQKAATNSENRDHKRIQLHREEKRRWRD